MEEGWRRDGERGGAGETVGIGIGLGFGVGFCGGGFKVSFIETLSV